jgi:NADPH:quinone reductase
VLRAIGPPSVLRLEEVEDPQPGPGQVLLGVHLANVTFVETQIRAGKPPRVEMLPKLPAILGNGVGGTVLAASDADKGLVGRGVITSLNGMGGYAERAVADASALIAIPHELGMDRALALLADGCTAVLLVNAAAVKRGETVLVEAAAGGVGSSLVQLAHNAGARVVGAAGGARKADVARALGADLVMDYSQPDWPKRLRSELNGRGVDVVFDGVGGDIGRAAFEFVALGSRFCAFGMAGGRFTDLLETDIAERDVTAHRGVQASRDELRQAAQTALELACEGHLRPLIGQMFPLAEAAEAHAAIEARATIGKTLLQVA